MIKFIEKNALSVVAALILVSAIMLFIKPSFETAAIFIACVCIFCAVCIMVKMEKLLK